MTLDNNEFWEGLDPKKPERLSKVLAALHCFHIAPPTDLFHYEFTVHPADHHRICGTFPELRSLEELIGKPIPFHFNASTGSLTTMYDARHHVGVAMALAIETGISLRSFYSYPGSVGALARRVQLQSGYPLVRATGHDQDGKPTGNAGPPALAFTSPLSKHPTLVLDFAGHENNAPSKHAQYITMHGARTVVSLQLSFNTMTPLGDKAKYKRMADNTAVWVWTTVNGEVKAVVQREPLSTPGGQIKLWLSDFSPMGEDKDLPSEFVRPLRDVAERAANITIPYSVILESLKNSSSTALNWSITGDEPLPSKNVSNRLPTNGAPGGKRFFSVAAHGAPAYRKAAVVALDPAVAARRASAASVGRFSTRFLRAFRK